MPDQVQNPADGGQQRGQPSIISSISRMFFMWWVLSFIRGTKPPASSRFLTNSFTKGEPVDLTLYVSEDSQVLPKMFKSEPLWELEDLGLATHPAVAKNLTVELPESAKRNGSLYLHAFFARSGHEINPNDAAFEEASVFHGVMQLNRYMHKRKERMQKNLLSAKEEGEPVEEVEVAAQDLNGTEIISYWKSPITLAIVDDFSKYSDNNVPPHLQSFMQVHEKSDVYAPMIFFNEFWVLKERMPPLNETLDSVTLELTVSTIKSWLVQLSIQFEQSLKIQEQWGMSDEEGKDSDDFKKILIDSNPYLLGLTMVVSLLHSVFEFMAFKSDIGFWKDNKSMKGLSAKSILINTGCQLIVTLYLLDNETNFMVMLGQIVGLLIECWKITKAMDVSFFWWGSLPLLSFKERVSYTEGNTKEHDDKAMQYLSYVLFPLVICYCIYTLIYEEHKSWYSWVLGSLVGAVYMFGFILMCPQLYLNYKLKSVAHLPGKQLTYKFLTTIIDDLFAFAIKMPSLHRLAVFRDDLVFLAYMYQWYVYGSDKKRVNEFGYTGEQQTEDTPGIENAETSEPQPDISSEDTGGTVHRRKPQNESSTDTPVGHIEEIEEDKPETDSKKVQ